jgi:hypothetical protein
LDAREDLQLSESPFAIEFAKHPEIDALSASLISKKLSGGESNPALPRPFGNDRRVYYPIYYQRLVMRAMMPDLKYDTICVGDLLSLASSLLCHV